MGMSGLRHVPAALYPRRKDISGPTGSVAAVLRRQSHPITPTNLQSTQRIGDWVGSRAGLNTEARGKFFASAGDRALIVQPVVRLYRLSYHSSISQSAVPPILTRWNTVAQVIKKSPPFIKTAGSSQRSQKPGTEPYPESVESNRISLPDFSKINFNIIRIHTPFRFS
jgi:hypothetical protein